MTLHTIYSKRVLLAGILIFLLLWVYEKVEKQQITNQEQSLLAQLTNLKKANDAYFSGDAETALTYFQAFDSLATPSTLLTTLVTQFDSSRKNEVDFHLNYSTQEKEAARKRADIFLNDKSKYSLDSLWEWAKATERTNLELAHQAYILQEKTKLETQKIKKLEDSLVSVSNVKEIIFTNRKGIKVTYFGETQYGLANGKGIGFYEGGGTYSGQWRNNSRNGKGKYTWKNGDEYEGEYKNGERYGQGTYTFKSGEKYVGEWKNDLREGQGALYDPYGQLKFKGIWKGDKYIK